jgi:hypothetical protein
MSALQGEPGIRAWPDDVICLPLIAEIRVIEPGASLPGSPVVRIA